MIFTNNYLYFVSFLGIFLCFIPFIYYHALYLAGNNNLILHQQEVSLFVGLILIASPLLDICLDRLTTFSCRQQGTLIKLYFVFSLVIPNIIMLRLLQDDNNQHSIVFVIHMQIIITFSGIFLYFISLSLNFQKHKNIIQITFTLLILSIVLQLNSYYMKKSISRLFIRLISISVLFCSICAFATFACHRLLTYYRQIINNETISVLDYIITSCTSLILFFEVGYFLILFICLLENPLDLHVLVYLTYLENFIVFVFLSLDARAVRQIAFIVQQELESKKEFLRTTSHEIRTPMNTIRLGVNLIQKELQENCLSNDTLQETLDNLHESTDIILELVNNLLTHDKLTEGILKLEKSPICVWNLILSTVKLFQTEAENAHIALTTVENVPGITDYFLDGDRHKLSQVIRNLISNAIKFTPAGGSITIRAVSVSFPDITKLPRKRLSILNEMSTVLPVSNHTKLIRWLRIEVTDNGYGISKENQSKLFKEVVQFNAASLQEGKGSGLGLMITKGIVDLHEGKISVTSEGEGHGTTFILELPVYLRKVTRIFSVERHSSSRSMSSRSIHSNRLSAGRTLLGGRGPGGGGGVGVGGNNTAAMGKYSNFLNKQSSSYFSESSLDETVEGNARVVVTPPLTSNPVFLGSVASIGQITYWSSRHNGSSSESLLDTTFEPENLLSKQGGGSSYIGSMNFNHTTSSPTGGNSASNSIRTTMNNTIFTIPELPTPSYSPVNGDSVDSRMILPQEQGNGSSKDLRVMIVDDSAVNRSMMCKLLRGRCSLTIEAEDGLEAVELFLRYQLNGEPLQIILMDFNMPRMNGPAAAKRLRDEGYTGIIIGATGSTIVEQQQFFLDSGADRVLTKPLDLQELDNLIAELMDTQRQSQTRDRTKPFFDFDEE